MTVLGTFRGRMSCLRRWWSSVGACCGLFEIQDAAWILVVPPLQVDPVTGAADAIGLNEYLDEVYALLGEGADGPLPWDTGPKPFANAIAGPVQPGEIRTIRLVPGAIRTTKPPSAPDHGATTHSSD